MPLVIGAIVSALLRVLFKYAFITIFSKLILGTATFSIIYYFLTNVAKPYTDDLQQQLVIKVGELSTVGGTAAEVIQYMDFVHCVNIILSASAAGFSLKIMSVAARAFGINTG